MALNFYIAITIMLAIALLIPFYRVLAGPTLFDRMVGVGVIGSKTIILLALVGYLFGRLPMFLDIMVAYSLLNFISTIIVAKYLERREVPPLSGGGELPS